MSSLRLEFSGLAALILTGLVSLAASADERKRGLPTPDPKAKARQSVRWKPPREWASLETRQGEFAAYRLQETLRKQGQEVTELGPRLVVHYLGPRSERRELAARTKSWARRFLSPERKRLLPEQAKVRPLSKCDPGLSVNLVEVRGDYSAALSPGQEPRPPQRDWTGLYAHVLAGDGVWVVVLLGPTKETQRWTSALEAFLRASKSGTVLIRPDPREAHPREAHPREAHPREAHPRKAEPASRPKAPAPSATPTPARPTPSPAPAASPREGAGER